MRAACLRHRWDVNADAAELSTEEAYRSWADDLVGYATVLVGASDAAGVVPTRSRTCSTAAMVPGAWFANLAVTCSAAC